jgi:hypothetical protein
MTSKWHRELFKRLETEGAKIVCVVRRSSCVALDVELEGRTIRYFTSITPSDIRSMDNAFHGIMRTLRAKDLLNVN